MRRHALLVAALALAAPAAASAAPVTVEGGALVYGDPTAAANVAGIQQSERTLYVSEDAGGGATPGSPGCRKGERGWVACPSAGLTKVAVDLGPGGDAFIADTLRLPLELLAGPGADVAIGGRGADTMTGGTQGDMLFGAAGADVLRGGDDDAGAGSGDDLLDGGAGIDTYFPGDGVDTISYGSSAEDLHLSLDGKRNDGKRIFEVEEGPQYEDVPDVEILEGGAGDDTVYALSGAHELRGNAGDDALYSGDGADVIAGGGGQDLVQSGGGDDLILLRDGDGGDDATCEGGLDTVVADRTDAINDDCERVLLPPQPAPVRPGRLGPVMGLGPRTTRLTTARRFPVTVTCPASLNAPCRGLLTLALRKRDGSAGRRIGANGFAISPGQTATGTIPLNYAGRQSSSVDRPIRAFLIADARVGGSAERRTQVPIVLRRQPRS